MMADRSSFVLHKVALIRTNFPYFIGGILRLKTFVKTSKILERNTTTEILSEINVKEIEKKRLDNKTALLLLTYRLSQTLVLCFIGHSSRLDRKCNHHCVSVVYIH